MHNYPIINKRFMHISNISNSPQTRSANVNATATANWLATAQRTQLTQFWQFVVLFHCESCRRAFNIHIQSKHIQTHRHTRKQCPGAYELSRLRPKWRSRKEKKKQSSRCNQSGTSTWNFLSRIEPLIYCIFPDQLFRRCACVCMCVECLTRKRPTLFQLVDFYPEDQVTSFCVFFV